MSKRHLTTYINDHLAGSVAALELLAHLISSHTGTSIESFFIELRQDIEQDRDVVQKFLQTLDTAESPIRSTGAWIGEKLSRAKLLLEDSGGGPLARLEQLEALALGVDGKRALWRALAAAKQSVPQLVSIDLIELEQRADQQRERVEVHRLQAAREAFTLAD